jgi:hypothetical protein
MRLGKLIILVARSGGKPAFLTSNVRIKSNRWFSTRSVGMNLARPLEAGIGGGFLGFASRQRRLKIQPSLTRRRVAAWPAIPPLRGRAKFNRRSATESVVEEIQVGTD